MSLVRNPSAVDRAGLLTLRRKVSLYAMARTTATKPKRAATCATREPLDRRRIVLAATRIANAQGTDALSMRVLAAELDVEAMSLYSHFTSKHALLGHMAAQAIEQIKIPSRTLAPRTRLHRLATDMRRIAQSNPAVFPLVVLHPLDMRAAARPVEIALQAFLDAGLSDQRAIRCQRVFLSFLRGYLLWEIGGFTAGRWRSADASLRAESFAEIRALDQVEFPETRRLAESFSRISPDQAFADGLSSVLATLLASATTSTAPRTRARP